MWCADNWKDYEILDTSSGEKLERWGDYLTRSVLTLRLYGRQIKLIRAGLRETLIITGATKGGGEWEFFDLPKQWTIQYDTASGKNLKFCLKPFSFKHTGLFPEQAVNWDWFGKKDSFCKKTCKSA